MDIKQILHTKSKDEIINMIVNAQSLQRVIRDQLITQYLKNNKSKNGVSQAITEISDNFGICERHVHRIIAQSSAIE